ncbi:MAG: hypothetical protein DRP29_01510 [Thermodesulfobacteriota bacterium]|nr:MAG: hypothetical protein DRP29_01510 [Thermodesulfobacteriota bacterium]RLG11566.1 MAG: hypothetical protein DRN73_05055 [Candidatus Pacearchaeota archaeon]
MRHRWLEHLSLAIDTFFEDITSFIPEKSKEHIRNARKEFLLALREVIDERIRQLEKPKKVAKKIKVEEAK